MAAEGAPAARWRDQGGLTGRSGRRTTDETTEAGNEMSVHGTMGQAGLVRPRDGRLLAGVCAGLGRRFGLEPWLARLLFVLVLMLLPGSQILIYPLLWVLMPAEPARTWATAHP